VFNKFVSTCKSAASVQCSVALPYRSEVNAESSFGHCACRTLFR